MDTGDLIGTIILIIIIYLCIHSLVSRICSCIECVTSIKCGVYPDSMKKTIKQTEETQSRE